MFAEFENMLKGKLNAIKDSPSVDISRVAQKYTIRGRQIQEIKLLSEGSFGFIWLAEDIVTKQKYALKRIVCITNDRLMLARNQLEVMEKFPKSKHLVGCFGGQLVTLRNGNLQNKVLVILMEYCPNGTLFDLLEKRENKGFTEKQLLQITMSILQGLRAIHQSGIYHQDVKIQNVLVGEDNCFKLCDFGSCSTRTVDFSRINKSEYSHIREEMEAVTTPMYRPPEMVDPYLQFEVSSKVDLWMVGCVLYTLAYFTHPFVDANAIGIAGGVYRFPKYPEETKYQVSDKIKDLIRNFLTPNPAYRPSTEQAIQIINNWYTSSEVPLNKEARKRKQEEKVKEQQLAVLNRRVVDFDGDIPMQKLMELQNKLKNKEGVSEAKQASFITSKETLLLKEGKMLAQNKPANYQPSRLQQQPPQPQHSHSQPSQSSQPQQARKQQSFDMNSFWNPSANQPAKSSGNKFDAFSNFFPTSNEPAKKQNNMTDMYDQFFSDKPARPASQNKKPQNNNEINLLDL